MESSKQASKKIVKGVGEVNQDRKLVCIKQNRTTIGRATRHVTSCYECEYSEYLQVLCSNVLAELVLLLDLLLLRPPLSSVLLPLPSTDSPPLLPVFLEEVVVSVRFKLAKTL